MEKTTLLHLVSCLHRHLLHVFAVLTAKPYFYLVLSDTGYTLLIILIQYFKMVSQLHFTHQFFLPFLKVLCLLSQSELHVGPWSVVSAQSNH